MPHSIPIVRPALFVQAEPSQLLEKNIKIKNSLLIKSALPVVTQKVHTSPVMLRLPAAAKQ